VAEVELREHERIDNLIHNNLKIIQNTKEFRFSFDAVLLAHFVTVHKRDKVLDLGTGTGIIPLLLSNRTMQEIYGLEIQPLFVDMARRSVRLNGLEHRLHIIEGDLRRPERYLPLNQFDVVTVNPPYMPLGSGETNPSSSKAIARHEILCTLDDVVRASAQLVNSQGRVAMVHRPSRLVEILGKMVKYQLEPKRLRMVHAKLGEKPNLILIEAIKQGQPSLDILPPLYIYDANGEYTDEVKQIYF